MWGVDATAEHPLAALWHDPARASGLRAQPGPTASNYCPDKIDALTPERLTEITQEFMDQVNNPCLSNFCGIGGWFRGNSLQEVWSQLDRFHLNSATPDQLPP